MFRNVLFLTILSSLLASAKEIEVFVCLCDNEHQGIQKVGKAIGNGMDPPGNLYWGCSDGLSTYFKRSSKWTLTKTEKPNDSPILITLSFTHKTSKTELIAHAYRGDMMKECLEAFLLECRDAGREKLVAFIGHNGLMDTSIEIPKIAEKNDERSSSIVLACLTGSFFEKPLHAMNTEPLLLTKSLMYPGAFLLHDAIEVWLKNGSKTQIREAAAKAYAKNQKISVRAARGIFSELK